MTNDQTPVEGTPTDPQSPASPAPEAPSAPAPQTQPNVQAAPNDTTPAVAPQEAVAPLAGAAVPVRSPEERKAALAQAIARSVAGGARVESQSDFQAVVVNGKKVNHLLHFIIGFVTFALWWIFVWIPLAIFGGEKREIIQVDEYGNVLVQKT